MANQIRKTLASILASGLIALNACASVPNYKCPNLANKVTTEKTQEYSASQPPQHTRSTQDSYWDSKEQRLTLYDCPAIKWQFYITQEKGKLSLDFFIPEMAIDEVIKNDSTPKDGVYEANDFPTKGYGIIIIDINKDKRPEKVMVKVPEEELKYLEKRFGEELSINTELDRKASDEREQGKY